MHSLRPWRWRRTSIGSDNRQADNNKNANNSKAYTIACVNVKAVETCILPLYYRFDRIFELTSMNRHASTAEQYLQHFPDLIQTSHLLISCINLDERMPKIAILIREFVDGGNLSWVVDHEQQRASFGLHCGSQSV
jgi:hypothetical protein